MSTASDSSVDKWFSVYVPAASGSTGGTQSYLRIGSPDSIRETSLINALRTTYGASTDAGVKAAFDQTSAAGVVLYTAGDMVQFVNGTSDTRVLNDRYIVHVLNKDTRVTATTDGKKATAGDSPTYRSYFRLGKPYDVIEGALQGTPDDTNLADFIKALAPTAPSPAITDAAAMRNIAVDSGDAAAGTSAAEARPYLQTQAERADRGAIDALDALMKSTVTSSKATAALQSAAKDEASSWARAALQGLHIKFANQRKSEALLNTGDGRTKLAAAAQATTNKDPVARRKIIEIYELSTAGLASHGTVTGLDSSLTPEKVTNAQNWAKGILDTLPEMSSEMLSRWSMGDGVALYSDRPITMTTPDKLAVTVGSDSRTVLGETYAETYDVSDDIIAQIKSGAITTLDQVSSKKLVTATLVRRDMGNCWRTTTLDRSKSLGFKYADYGSCELSCSYAFAAGLKFSNGVAASFDASMGLGASISLAAKVEVSGKSVKTSWAGGEIAYDPKKQINGDLITLEIDAGKNTAAMGATQKYALAANIVMGVLNLLAFVYSGRAATIGTSSSDSSKTQTEKVHAFLEECEQFYVAATVLNACMLAAGIVVGILQIIADGASDVAAPALPAQMPNIKMNSTGIVLTVGPTSIEITSTGVKINGLMTNISAPVVQIAPVPVPPNVSPVVIAHSAQAVSVLATAVAATTGTP